MNKGMGKLVSQCATLALVIVPVLVLALLWLGAGVALPASEIQDEVVPAAVANNTLAPTDASTEVAPALTSWDYTLRTPVNGKLSLTPNLPLSQRGNSTSRPS